MRTPEILKDIEARPLTYHHAIGRFVIGESELAIDSPGLVTAVTLSAPSGNSLLQLANHPVHIGPFGNPLATPVFYDYLELECQQQVLDDTTTVMREVFEGLSRQVLEGDDFSNSVDAFGFSARFLRKGHVVLSVLGNCACLGVEANGMFIDYHDWDTRFAEYGFHNVDSDIQLISLLAGLGYLSTLAKEQAPQE